MRKAEHPTSIRLPADLKKKLRYQAEQDSRTLAVHIVHILKMATAMVHIPKRWREDGEHVK